MDPKDEFEAAASPSSHAEGTSQSPAGFCQECGRALLTNSVRRVDNGVFCPPCASQRPHATAWQSVHAGVPPGVGQAPRGPGVPGAEEPNPVLAGFFGAIPGVGAMYNGQYAKGAMHLLIFVVLVTLADNLNWVLWWLVWGWVFYQIFEAYHTARARRDNLPLPNPFGWNDLGERMGFHRTSPPDRPADPSFAQQRSQPASPWAPYTQPTATEANPPGVPFSPAAHNPYTAPPPPTRQTPVVPISPQPPTSVPYSPTYTGTAPGYTPPTATGVSESTTSRFPGGALWLIGLGGLFLLGNVLPAWRLSGRWMAPVLLAAVAAWSALRRWNQLHRGSASADLASSFAGALAGPIVLGTVAVLLALQAADLLSLKRSWPVLLVMWGFLLLVRRSTVASTIPLQPTAVPDPVAPPVRSTSGTGSYGL